MTPVQSFSAKIASLLILCLALAAVGARANADDSTPAALADAPSAVDAPAAQDAPSPPEPTDAPAALPPEPTGSAPPSAEAPTEKTPPPPASAAAPRTHWAPFDEEVTRVADGSLRVCGALALPLTIVPGVGDVIGTVADWFCVVPAAIAVDYAGAHHGHRETNTWQPALGLVLKKGWETIVDTPIIVVTIGAVVAIAAGGVAAFAFGGIPLSVVAAGATGISLAIYLGLKAARDSIGNFIFKKTYDVLVDETSDTATATAREESWLTPGMEGVPAGFGLMATVAGSRPSFDWAYAVPVVGPVWRSEASAAEIKARTRRFAREVLLVEKADLSGVDATSDALAGVQGYAMAAGQVGIIVGLALVGGGLAVALADTNNEAQVAADVLGTSGIVSVIGGAGFLVISTGAERLQALAVPLAWGAAE